MKGGYKRPRHAMVLFSRSREIYISLIVERKNKLLESVHMLTDKQDNKIQNDS